MPQSLTWLPAQPTLETQAAGLRFRLLGVVPSPPSLLMNLFSPLLSGDSGVAGQAVLQLPALSCDTMTLLCPAELYLAVASLSKAAHFLCLRWKVHSPARVCLKSLAPYFANGAPDACRLLERPPGLRSHPQEIPASPPQLRGQLQLMDQGGSRGRGLWLNQHASVEIPATAEQVFFKSPLNMFKVSKHRRQQCSPAPLKLSERKELRPIHASQPGTSPLCSSTNNVHASPLPRVMSLSSRGDKEATLAMHHL